MINDKTKFVACARLGSKTELVTYGTAEELGSVDFGKAPYCLIIPGKMHFVEEDVLNSFAP